MLTLYIGLGVMIPMIIIGAVVYMIVRMVRGGDNANSLKAKEVGIELGMFVALFFSIVSVVQIIFSAIDKKFPDVLTAVSYNGVGILNDDMRLAVSIAAIAFPIYLGLAWMRANYLKANASRREVSALKYSQYAVMTLSGLFIVGTLMYVLYNYLGGSSSTAGALKALTVIVLSLVLGAYNYFLSERKYTNSNTSSIVATIVSLVVVFGIMAYSISIIGSPATIRKIRFDEKRIEGLTNIQSQVLNYWQRTKTLPGDIAQLNSGDVSGYNFIAPTDPVDKTPFAYRVIENSKIVKSYGQNCKNYYPSKFTSSVGVSCEIPSPAKFEICATFEAERNYDENGNNLTDQKVTSIYQTEKSYDLMNSYYNSYDVSPFWNHGLGLTCFTRTIDPIKYPVY